MDAADTVRTLTHCSHPYLNAFASWDAGLGWAAIDHSPFAPSQRSGPGAFVPGQVKVYSCASSSVRGGWPFTCTVVRRVERAAAGLSVEGSVITSPPVDRT